MILDYRSALGKFAKNDRNKVKKKNLKISICIQLSQISQIKPSHECYIIVL